MMCSVGLCYEIYIIFFWSYVREAALGLCKCILRKEPMLAILKITFDFFNFREKTSVSHKAAALAIIPNRKPRVYTKRIRQPISTRLNRQQI